MTDERPTMLLDVNVLVALSLTSHQHHLAAHHALRGMDSWATTPLTEAALVRLLLNRAIVGQQLTAAAALKQLRGMRGDHRWRFLPDDTTLAEAVLDTTPLIGHSQVTDFHLVNLAARSDARLATFDRALVEALAPDDRGHVELLSTRTTEG